MICLGIMFSGIQKLDATRKAFRARYLLEL